MDHTRPRRECLRFAGCPCPDPEKQPLCQCWSHFAFYMINSVRQHYRPHPVRWLRISRST